MLNIIARILFYPWAISEEEIMAQSPWTLVLYSLASALVFSLVLFPLILVFFDWS